MYRNNYYSNKKLKNDTFCIERHVEMFVYGVNRRIYVNVSTE